MHQQILPALVVHGGAWEIPQGEQQAHIEGCQQAAQAAWAVLQSGGPSLDAVEAAVRLLEDNPTFNAGRGAHLNRSGQAQLDAIIMNGQDLSVGAVSAVQQIAHPVSLARKVMTESEHNFLTAQGAEAFARSIGFPICQPQELVVEREQRRYQALKNNQPPPERSWPGDTVGAVALDVHGNLAAATSTGGTLYKLPGRVGDSPLVGCGAYADNRSAAVSATGEGEALMKIVTSKAVCDQIAQGASPQQAADTVIALLAERTGGQGGVILVDHLGRFGIAHNSPCLAHAVITSGGQKLAGVEYHI